MPGHDGSATRVAVVAMASEGAVPSGTVARLVEHGGQPGDGGDRWSTVWFDDMVTAVDTAVTVRELLADDRVRVAIGHTGTTDARRLPHVADLAHPGQVVVCEPDPGLAQRLPAVTCTPLGVHRLRDLGPAVEVWQAAAADEPLDFPPPGGLDRIPNNLPTQLSTFVGRHDDLAAVTRALGTSRLVTVTGPGGAGKTRLAVQVAALMAGRPSDEVWIARLEEADDAERVAQAVAGAVGVGADVETSTLDRLVERLADRRVLLVLDNCEHVVDPAAHVTTEVLVRCPRARVVATSRRPLAVPGESVFMLSGMPCESDEADLAPGTLRPCDAVQLFLDRATAADAGLSATEDTVRAAARICRRLDGLPLAIELAGARTRTLALADIESQLDDRFRLLTGGARTAPRRHQTLEAAVEWSHDLLDDDEQVLFDRLGVFHGPVTADDVQQVGGAAPLGSEAIPELLSGLVDQSLVVAERDGEVTRYRQLETLRTFARRQLDRGDGRPVRDAHLDWVVQFVAAAGRHLSGPQQPQWLERVASQLGDVLAAVDHALTTGRAAQALAVLVPLQRYWYLRDIRRGIELLDRARDRVDLTCLPAGQHSRVRLATAVLRVRTAEYEAAAADLERAVALARDHDDDRLLGHGLVRLASARWRDADPDELRHLLDEAEVVSQRVGDVPGQALTALFQFLWAAAFGSREQVIELGPRCRQLLAATGSPQLAAHGDEMAALAADLDGRPVDADADARAALATYQRLDSRACAAHGLSSVAKLLADRGRHQDAARVLGAAAGIRDRLALPIPEYELLFVRPLHDQLVRQLGTDTFRMVHANGSELGFDDAITCTLTLLDDAADGDAVGRVDTPPAGRAHDRSTTVFRLLGPVEVTRDGDPIDVGPTKQRQVLARLLLSEGDPVSVDALAEAVWSDRPPAKPRASLQAYVSRLRAALGGDHTIAASTAGYAIDVAGADLDLHVAERALADTHCRDDPPGTARMCEDALALWRGRPLDDLGDLPVVTTLRSRAAEVRRRLVRAHATALLEIDRPDDAVTSVTAVLDDHPYDEELHALLLRGLAASGRHGEALRAYDRLRQRLAGELGSEPTPGLRQLHVDLLNHQAG